MTLRKPGHLAIHRRSDEISFLQHRLRVLGGVQVSHEDGKAQAEGPEALEGQRPIQIDAVGARWDLELEALLRERDLTDELLHTRQIEPLGEALQRRLAMAERVCTDLALRSTTAPHHVFSSSAAPQADRGVTAEHNDRTVPHIELVSAENQHRLPAAYWVAEVERRALAAMLDQWWLWLRES